MQFVTLEYQKINQAKIHFYYLYFVSFFAWEWEHRNGHNFFRLFVDHQKSYIKWTMWSTSTAMLCVANRGKPKMHFLFVNRKQKLDTHTISVQIRDKKVKRKRNKIKRKKKSKKNAKKRKKYIYWMRNKAEETEKVEFVEKKVRKVNILQKIFIVHESSVSKICFGSL